MLESELLLNDHSIQGICIPDHIYHIHHSYVHIHIHHIHHSSRDQHQTWAQPQPHACHSIQDQHHIHHILDHSFCIPHHRIPDPHSIHHSSRDQPWPRLQALQPHRPPGRELRAFSC